MYLLIFTAHHTERCSSTMANTWDEDMDFTVPTDYVLVGVYAYHKNKHE